MSPAFHRRADALPSPAVEAARWALVQQEGEMTPAREAEFAAWLAADAAHLAAYEDALWALDAASRHAGAPEIMALRSAALMSRGARRPRWQKLGGGALAATLMLGALWIAAVEVPGARIEERGAIAAADPASADYATRVGERSTYTLPDGSVLTLDTDSHVRIAYTAGERGVYLDRGQAMFEVAHGKALPFTVYARGQRITALGTKFNVRLDGSEVRVAMVEGRVRVERTQPASALPDNRPRAAVTLNAGDMLIVEPQRAMVVEPADARQIASWTGGVLTFNDTPLADAVAEVNRYSASPIAIADPRIGSYRISGVFKSNDPEHFARAMTEFLPVEMRKAADGETVLSARK